MNIPENELNDIALPKWPELRVVGISVTPDQAKEIIIRTDDSVHRPRCNDKSWARKLAETLSLPDPDKFAHENLRDLWAAVFESLGHLQELQYLRPSRICGAYVGGSHGWIDWNGFVGTSGHNIGKWPTAKEVFEEWQIIAKTFPYLELRAQLFSGEQCETDSIPLVEYLVREGKVTASLPDKPFPIYEGPRYRNILDPNNERYCSIELLEEAIRIAKSKVNK